MSERTRPSGRLIGTSLLAAALVALAAGTAAGASALRIEAESFEPYGSYNIGGYGIEVAYCSYASGALAVDGLDVPGEWFRLKVTFDNGGCYETRLDYQSDYGDTVDLVVRLLDYPSVGEELRADYRLINGYGFG